jgi:hypothetical protein
VNKKSGMISQEDDRIYHETYEIVEDNDVGE